jgi:hypothetical protein
MIGNFSDFPEVENRALQPDYGKLYRYIAAILDESLSMPDLSPLGKYTHTRHHVITSPTSGV